MRHLFDVCPGDLEAKTCFSDSSIPGPSCPSRLPELRNAYSVIAFTLSQLSAEDPINEYEVAENDRQRHQRAH
jgi:hypothetical protein